MTNQENCCEPHGNTSPAQPQGQANTLLKVDEVADMLRVSAAWVRDHATRKEPRLPMLRVGKRLRFLPTDIVDWIEKQKKLAERLKLAC